MTQEQAMFWLSVVFALAASGVLSVIIVENGLAAKRAAELREVKRERDNLRWLAGHLERVLQETKRAR